MIKKHKTE